MPKKLTSNQALELESRNALHSALIGWALNDLHNDFGLDVVAQLARPTSESHREMTSLSCFIQLKASSEFSGSDSIRLRLDTDFMASYWNCSVPVVLVAYEAASESLYWTVLQDSVHNELTYSRPEWWSQDTVSIPIDRTNRLTDIDDFGTQLSEAQRDIERRLFRHFYSEYELPDQTLRGDTIGHLINFQTGLIEAAERNAEESEEAARHTLEVLRSSFEVYDDLEVYVVDLPHFCPSSYLFDGYDVCKRSSILSSGIRAKKLAEEFSLMKNEFYHLIRLYMIGNKYLDCEINEPFIVVDVCDWWPESAGTGMIAAQQYSDGTPWDEIATTIAKNIDYQLLNFESLEFALSLMER